MSPEAYRIGHGFDLHRLEAGRPLVIGGQNIEHESGAVGHSDGDVVYHTLTDALLGAVGAPDIGQLFPDNDPAHAGADSSVFVTEAARRIDAAGYRLVNADLTVVCQRPKLSAHKQAMARNIASLLGCDVSQINLKAKTHENVDALGEGRAIACHGVVLLVKK
ncbi:MAG: 2-C-methyl-D-erythritol 2,4-cyclodiphosphate synthase [Phycisphaeraceae bacterium]|nr:2-C-methyl-D-erythritol 2,4-cyclodiphosphate synthase [Phycisphaeraceae bacterium]